MKKRTRFEGFSLYFHDWTNGSKENYRVSLVWQIAFKWSRGGVDHRSVGKEDESRWVCAEKLHCGPADQIAALLSTCIIQINAIYFLGPFLRAARRTPTVPVLCVRTDCPSILFKQKKPTHTFRKIKYPREIGVRRAIQTYVLHLSVRRCLTAADKQKNSHEGGGCVEATRRSLKKGNIAPFWRA